MRIRLLLTAGLCVLGSQISVGVIAAGFIPVPMLPQKVAPTDAAVRKDVYAIYSALISEPPLRANAPADIYLIHATTVTGSRDLESCLKVAQGDADSRAEILADYNRRKSVTEVLEREFTLANPYQLLSTSEADKFLTDNQKAKPVLFFSAVYFNQNRTRASVWAEQRVTRLTSRGFWETFKKSTDGKWEWDRTWPVCSLSGVP